MRRRGGPGWAAGWVSLLVVGIALGTAGYLWWARYEKPERRSALKIQVLGNSQIRTEQLLRAARVESGIFPVGMTLEELKERLLRLPSVKDVKLEESKKGALTIKIAERKPCYNVMAGGRWFIADESGTVYAGRSQPIQHLMRITVGEAMPANLPAPAKELRELGVAMQTAEKWRAEKGPALGGIRVTMAEGIELTTLKGLRVICGQPMDKEEKLETAVRMLRSSPQMQTENEYIDVSVPGSEVCKPKKSGAGR